MYSNWVDSEVRVHAREVLENVFAPDYIKLQAIESMFTDQ